MNNAFFTGDLLIHQNETCPAPGPQPVQPNVGGISLWDVSDPTNPVAVKLHAGDYMRRRHRPVGEPDAQHVRLDERVRRAHLRRR